MEERLDADTLRKGTNRLVCFDKSGLPGQLPFSIECTSVETSTGPCRT